jgi:hypothetical protein
MFVAVRFELRQEARMFGVTIDREEQTRRQQILKDELVADGLACFARLRRPGIPGRKTDGAGRPVSFTTESQPTNSAMRRRSGRDTAVLDRAQHVAHEVRRHRMERTTVVVDIGELNEHLERDDVFGIHVEMVPDSVLTLSGIRVTKLNSTGSMPVTDDWREEER